MSSSKVYTKTGDSGETSLLTGSRVKKHDQRIGVYGDIDELNSHIGCIYAFNDDSSIKANLQIIQSTLFNIGSVVSCPEDKRESFQLPETGEAEVEWLESKIDYLDNGLPTLKNFILPGGNQSASFAHVCRTVCRRAERECIRYNCDADGDIPPLIIKYLNRLSDYFFVLGRHLIYANNDSEVLWKKS